MQAHRLWVGVSALALACGGGSSHSGGAATSNAATDSAAQEEEQTSALPCAGLTIVISSRSDGPEEEEERITIRCGATEITYDDGDRVRPVEMNAWERAWSTLDRLDWEGSSEECSTAAMSLVRGRDPDLQRICVAGDSPRFEEVYYTAREVISPFDTP